MEKKSQKTKGVYQIVADIRRIFLPDNLENYIEILKYKCYILIAYTIYIKVLNI